MTYKLDAYCDLYCGACFIMTAYNQNRTDCIPAEWLSSIQNMEFKCYGCKSEILFENCRGCNIRKCAQSKGIELCNECSEYPCKEFKRIEKYNLPHHNVSVHSFDIIKEVGVQTWLKQQKERWLCSKCKHPFSWYEENCIKCGSELFNSVKEDQKLKNKSTN